MTPNIDLDQALRMLKTLTPARVEVADALEQRHGEKASSLFKMLLMFVSSQRQTQAAFIAMVHRAPPPIRLIATEAFDGPHELIAELCIPSIIKAGGFDAQNTNDVIIINEITGLVVGEIDRETAATEALGAAFDQQISKRKGK